jgi:hypothetical protein
MVEPAGKEFLENFLTTGSIMSYVYSKLERSLFGVTALFCVGGLSISLGLILAYDLRLADAWL